MSRERNKTHLPLVDVPGRSGADVSESLLSLISREIEDVLWVKDLETDQILHISRNYESVWGRPLEAIYTRSDDYLQAIHLEDREKLAQLSADTTGRKAAEYRIQLPDGGTRWIWSRAEIVSDGEKKYEVGIATDVTQRKRNELEPSRQVIQCRNLTCQMMTLHDCEIFFHAVEHATNAMIITDPEGIITHVNRAFEVLYGYTKAETIGNNPRILNPGPQVYRDLGYDTHAYRRLFESLWNGIKDPNVGFWEGDVFNGRKDGTFTHIHLFIHSIRDKDNRITSYVGMPIDVTKQRENENRIRFETYAAIADIAAQRDNDTGAHMKRLGIQARLLATYHGCTSKFCEDIFQFAPLHDIGKVGIQDRILLTPRRLTNAEMEIMKTHTEIGYRIFRGKAGMEMAAEIAHSHHERFDGTGYPQGLEETQTPLSARITCLVDVYDALRHERPYKNALSHEVALEVIRAGRGTHFDPALVDCFVQYNQAFDTIQREYPDNVPVEF
jgi:PAS domain S-box-containing protein